MPNSIISNLAALNAQSNLARASAESSASISRLSSGNRIAQASDDVAGLAVGTILKTNVTALQTSLSNTVQADAFLKVADGALASLGDISQRIKALATQATSGSLDDKQRGFLNAEAQNLVKEIDRISSNTNFNGINLIDGSLFAPAKIEDSIKLDSTAAAGSFQIATALVDGDKIFINDVTITARATASLTANSIAEFDATLITTPATQADAIANIINNILNYQGTDTQTLSDKAKLGQLSFDHTAATDTIKVTSKVAGTIGNGAATGAAAAAFGIGSSTATPANFKVNGQDAGNIATSAAALGIGSGAATTVAVDGGLNGGTFGTTSAYSGTARTIAQGSVTDSILRALTTTAQATTGVDASQVSNNAAFVGNIIEKGDGFKTTFMADNLVDVSIQVGDYEYIARNVNTNPATNAVLNFSSVQAGGGSFSLQMDAGKGIDNIVDQDSSEVFSTRLNSALNGVDFYQNRDVTNYIAAGTVYPTGSTTTAVGDLAGSSFKMINSDFSDLEVSAIKVSAPVIGATTPTITVTINGEDYVSGFDATGAASVLPSSITNNGGAATDGKYGFVSTTNPKNMLVFQYKSATALDLSNSANAEGFQDALTKAFGVNSGASGVSFQVGSNVTDSIGVQIESTRSNNIFRDSDGVYSAVDISTKEGAAAAGDVVTNAINTLTSIRANIGALQSRFNYAASNLNTAIQNQDSARGTFLDTDIAAESTKFAQSQVRLQASVSVLAQANQLPQNLLKLIG